MHIYHNEIRPCLYVSLQTNIIDLNLILADFIRRYGDVQNEFYSFGIIYSCKLYMRGHLGVI